MRAMAIKLLCLAFLGLFYLNLASAININFNSPDRLYQNEEFDVTIEEVDAPGVLDVKIYLMNESGKIVSEIYGEKWQSSNYYINSAYPSQNSFKLIVTNYNGKAKMCVKLRQSGKTSALGEVCRDINIITKEEPIEPELSTNDLGDIININDSNNWISEDIINNATNNLPEDNKPIVLENKKIYSTSYYSNRILLIYGFVILCILIIILLALKRI